MRGFIWLPEPAPPPDVPMLAEAELWCIRDAICQLMGWLPGSEDHCAFIELPGKQNIYRLAAHLGLTIIDLENMVQMTVDHPDYWEHPGAVQYELDVPGVPESEPLAHMIYESDLQNQQGLPPQYDEYSPVPHLIVVDTSQPPRLLELLREYAVHCFCAMEHDGPDLVPVDGLSGRLVLVADQIGGPGKVVRAGWSSAADHSAMTSPAGPTDAQTRTSPASAAAIGA